MLVVYNGDTKCIYDNNNTKLWHISVKIIEPRLLELSIAEFKVNLDLDAISKSELNKVNCIKLVNGKYVVKKKYRDCGDVIAKWLTQYVSHNV